MSEPNAQDSEEECPRECWNFSGQNVAPLIDDCSKLLDYATDHGKDVKPPVAKQIAEARSAFARGKWNPQHEENLYNAKAALTDVIKPVTLDALSTGTIQDSKKLTRFYFRLTFALVIAIVPVSMIVFMDSDLSAKGKDLIDSNDKIALVIHDELQNHRIDSMKALATPASSAVATSMSETKKSATANGASVPLQAFGPTPVPTALGDLEQSETPAALELKEHLQEFARNNRQLYAETQWLIKLTMHGSANTYESPWMLTGPTQRQNLELTLPILVSPDDVRSERLINNQYDPKPAVTGDAIDDGMQKLAVYQDIRAMAQDAQRTSDIVWGAITSYVLPVLYAVLGALAFILREVSDKNFHKTFYPAYARFINRTRLLTAVIVGTVIGLFSNLWKTPIASASPLAIAFLAGYAADTFFSFLDKAAASREKDPTA